MDAGQAQAQGSPNGKLLRRVTFVLGLAVAVGFGFAVWNYYPRAPKEVMISSVSPAISWGRIKVFVGEDEIGNTGVENPCKLYAPAGTPVADFRTLVLCPQGWKECQTGAGETASYYFLNITMPRPTVLLVDLHERGEVAVSCGELQFKITKTHADKFTFAGPDEPTRIDIDGKDAGMIDGARAYLVDPSGMNSFRFKKVPYWPAQYVFPGLKIPGSETTALEAALVHELPSCPDYFLKSAPERLDDRSTGMVSKTELTRTP